MRYRIKEYGVSIDSSTLGITIKNVPQEVYDAIMTTGGGTGYVTSESLRLIEESIRLITDETRAGYIVCSTGQKGVLSSAVKIVASNVNNWITLNFSKSALITVANGDEKDLAAIAAMASTDQFTIEMDFGEAPSELGGGGITMMTAAEYAPALSALSDAIDALDEEDDEEESVES